MPINLLPKNFQEKEKEEIQKRKKMIKNIELRVPKNKLKVKHTEKSKGNFFSNFFYPLFFNKKKEKNSKLINEEKEKFLEEKKRKEITDFLKNKKDIKSDAKKEIFNSATAATKTNSKKNDLATKPAIKKQSFWQWFLGKKTTENFQTNNLKTQFNDFDKNRKKFDRNGTEKTSEEKSFWQKGKIKEKKIFSNEDNKAFQESKKKTKKKIIEKKKNNYKKESFWQKLFGEKKEKNNKKDSSKINKIQVKNKEKNNNKTKEKKLNILAKSKKKHRIRNFFHKKTEIDFIDGELIASAKLKIKEMSLSIIFVLFFSLIIIFSIYMLVNWYQYLVIEKSVRAEKKLQSLKKDIDFYEIKKKEALNFQKKLKAISYLLSKHISWNNFFDTLEKITLPDVYYKNISVDYNGNVFISAETNSFKKISEQLLVFQNNKDLIKSVKIDTAELNSEGEDNNKMKIVKFNIVLKINKNAFFYKDYDEG
ncbi:MAG: hypothetical protein GWO87_00400 [Xanthomonadaceae bacterium]|nr:hypothetical protein [Rhodospirillaceae bacterium]NIA17641.1 hypothetical protein [Xanthomonadaceae bacterium]